MEEESGDPLPPSVGDPAGGSMEEEENRDPLPLCRREKMPPCPCVSSPSAQWSPVKAFLDSDCGGSFEKDSIPGTARPCPSYSPQFSYSPQWFPPQWFPQTEFDIPCPSYSPQWFPQTEFDDKETVMSSFCTLWNWSDVGGQTVSVETMMAGIAMTNHAAAEPVAGAAALSPLRQQNLRPMNLDLDFTTTSSKEASGPSSIGDEVAPMALQPPSGPLPSTEAILANNDATSVAMAEQANVPVEVPQSKEQSLLRIQTMMATGLLAQKNQGQLHVEDYAQAQHSGASGNSVPRSNAQAQVSGASGSSVRRTSKVWMFFTRVCTETRHEAVCKHCSKVLQANSNLGTSRLRRHIHACREFRKGFLEAPSEVGSNCLDLQKIEIAENPISLSRKKESENENEHIELGNDNMEVQPGDMSRNHTDDIGVFLANMRFSTDFIKKSLITSKGEAQGNQQFSETEVEPSDMPREPIVEMDVDSAKVKDVSQSNELFPLIEGSSSQVENIPGNFSTLDAAIGIKGSRQNEDKLMVAGTQLMSWKRPTDINSFKNDHPRSGENRGDNEVNEVDGKDVKVGTGDASRKRKKCASESESESEVWLYFEKVLDGSGDLIAGICKQEDCGKSLKARTKNGTSSLLRHAKAHGIEIKSRSPKTKTKRRVATTTKAKVAQPSAPDKVPSDVIMLEDSGDTVDKLPRLELQLLHRINSTPEQEVLVRINDVTIKKQALESLADSGLEDGPPRYLQDDIIDAYIYILKDKKKDDTRAHGRVYIETTARCLQLLYGYAFSISAKKNCGIEYLKHDMIFLPINENCNHWYLAVINTKKQEVQVLDSKKQLQERKELKLMLKKMEQCLELASNEVQYNSWPDYKLASWKVMDESQIPKQIDRSSCGLYVIKYMEYWTGEKMSRIFTQADIELFRLKLAAELMSSPLNKAR